MSSQRLGPAHDRLRKAAQFLESREADASSEQWAIWSDVTTDGYVHAGNTDGALRPGEEYVPEDREANPVAMFYIPSDAELAVTLRAGVRPLISWLRIAAEILSFNARFLDPPAWADDAVAFADAVLDQQDRLEADPARQTHDGRARQETAAARIRRAELLARLLREALGGWSRAEEALCDEAGGFPPDRIGEIRREAGLS